MLLRAAVSVWVCKSANACSWPYAVDATKNCFVLFNLDFEIPFASRDLAIFLNFIAPRRYLLFSYILFLCLLFIYFLIFVCNIACTQSFSFTSFLSISLYGICAWKETTIRAAHVFVFRTYQLYVPNTIAVVVRFIILDLFVYFYFARTYFDYKHQTLYSGLNDIMSVVNTIFSEFLSHFCLFS